MTDSYHITANLLQLLILSCHLQNITIAQHKLVIYNSESMHTTVTVDDGGSTTGHSAQFQIKFQSQFKLSSLRRCVQYS